MGLALISLSLMNYIYLKLSEEMEKEKIKAAIKFATSNKKGLAISEKAGCYHCMCIFPANEVTDFLASEQTAFCPYCGIDSVLPDKSPYNLNLETLKELNEFWF